MIVADGGIACLNAAKRILVEQYDVFAVSSGKELFEALDSSTPDLLPLDVDMPEMSDHEGNGYGASAGCGAFHSHRLISNV